MTNAESGAKNFGKNGAGSRVRLTDRAKRAVSAACTQRRNHKPSRVAQRKAVLLMARVLVQGNRSEGKRYPRKLTEALNAK